MFLTILYVLFFLAAPAAILWSCSKVKFLDIIGPVVVCYILGIIIGNAGIFPENIFLATMSSLSREDINDEPKSSSTFVGLSCCVSPNLAMKHPFI
mgnify:CR=1 FL=1